MISLIISKLQNLDINTSKKLISIYKGEQPEKDENFYISTVFGSEKQYKNLEIAIKSKLLLHSGKKLVNSPLIFIKSNQDVIFFSREKQGVSFGSTLVDYIDKTPLICFVIEKSNEGYTYTSETLNLTTKKYELNSTSKNCNSIIELLDFAYEELGKDIEKFIQK